MTDAGARWTPYNDAQADRGARALCTQLLAAAGPGRGRRALDLGAGAGVETRALAAQGWRVHAVDLDPRLRNRIGDLVRGGRVAVTVGDLRDATLPPSELVHSSLALSFVPPADLDTVWARICGSLLPGGWLGVDFFGPRDDWADVPTLTIRDRAAVADLVAGLDRVRIDEEEWDGASYGGDTKHWHVVQVLARVPLAGR